MLTFFDKLCISSTNILVIAVCILLSNPYKTGNISTTPNTQKFSFTLLTPPPPKKILSTPAHTTEYGVPGGEYPENDNTVDVGNFTNNDVLILNKMFKHLNDIENITNFKMSALTTNLYKILQHNTAETAAAYTMGINKFVYYSVEDIFKLYMVYAEPPDTPLGDGAQTVSSVDPLYPIYIPDSLDYREYGVVSPPKDQGDCGSCWAFAIAGSMESMNALETGVLTELSPQHLMDCSTSDNSCSGGLYASAMRFFDGDSWLYTNAEYPYVGRVQKCVSRTHPVAFKYAGVRYPTSGDDASILKYLIRYGPIPVSIRITDNFLFYSSGVFDDEKCNIGPANHALLLIGYGVEAKNNLEYWILKNSWGESWGEKGYLRLRRFRNFCGIASNSIVPIINFIES